MDRKIIVTYDYDDVLTGLNDYCIKTLGVDKDLITRFEIDKTKLSEQDKKRLLDLYWDVNSYKKAEWYKGVDETLDISYDTNINFYIHSHVISKDIGKYKKERLLGKGFNESCLNLQLGKEKEMCNTDILVEDRLLNVIKSPAKYKIIINQTWNQEIFHPEYSKYFKDIIRANDLEHANRIVKEIINGLQNI